MGDGDDWESALVTLLHLQPTSVATQPQLVKTLTRLVPGFRFISTTFACCFDGRGATETHLEYLNLGRWLT